MDTLSFVCSKFCVLSFKFLTRLLLKANDDSYDQLNFGLFLPEYWEYRHIKYVIYTHYIVRPQLNDLIWNNIYCIYYNNNIVVCYYYNLYIIIINNYKINK